MARGGYQIIDLKNNALPKGKVNAIVIEGIYDAIRATRKPLYLTNVSLNWGSSANELIYDVIATPSRGPGEYTILIPSYMEAIHITDDDEVYHDTVDMTGLITVGGGLKKEYVLGGGANIAVSHDDTLTVDEETGKLGVTPEASE